MKKQSEIYFSKVESTWGAGRWGWNPDQIKRYGDYREIEGKMSLMSDKTELECYGQILNKMEKEDNVAFSKLSKA